MNQSTPALLVETEQDWNLSHKDGWFQMVTAPARTRPVRLSRAEIERLAQAEALQYREERSAWHANLGPIRTPQIAAIFETLEELCGANRQDGEKVKPAAVLDALPGLGKSTAAVAFGKAFHREQISLYGPEIHADGGRWDRVPVAYLGLTSKTTMRSLNLMLCRFYGLPGIERANAERLAHRAAGCVGSCKTRLIIVDDVHFLDMASRDGREVANHFKWLANIFPVTFLFVGVGLRARGLLGEGLYGTDAVYSQTARRWSVLDLAPFQMRTRADRATWRALLLSIERDLILAEAEPGIVAEDLADYLFARCTGHFASLMSLINRGCYRAIRTGTEKLTEDLLEHVRIDEAAETARREIAARIPTQRTRPARGTR